MRESKQTNTNPERSLCSRSELVKPKRDCLSCFDCTSNHNGSECLVKYLIVVVKVKITVMMLKNVTECFVSVLYFLYH